MYSVTSVPCGRRIVCVSVFLVRIVCVWVCLVVRVYVWCRIDWFWLRFSVLIEMFVTTISFLSFRLGPWDDLGIYNRAVRVEVEIHKRAILVHIAVSWISQLNNQNQSIWCVCEESPSIRVATISRQNFFSRHFLERTLWKDGSFIWETWPFNQRAFFSLGATALPRTYNFIPICMYVFLFRCMYIYIYICKDLYICIYTYIHLYVCIYIYIHVFICICMHLHVYVYVHM